MNFIEKQASKYPNMADSYMELGRLADQRLWHQLTEHLSEFVMNKSNRKDKNLIELYEEFISKFEAKVNQLKLVQITVVIAQQFLSSSSPSATDFQKAIDFLKKLTEKRGRLGEEAYVVASMGVAELYTKMGAAHGSVAAGESNQYLDLAKDIFEETKPVLHSLEGSGAETVVNSSYYRVSAEYYKVRGPADDFYKASLQFLAYTPLETLDETVQVNLAIDMSLAALVGEGVYNFGEVLAQPILSKLDGTEYSWIHELLKVFSAGDIDRFNDLYVENQQAFKSQKVLESNMELLRQKLALLCLMQIVFKRPPEERNIDFSSIGEATKLDLDQVEWLLMRAMSKGLIKGRIDEIDQVVNVSWLKPRVLDVPQLSMLSEKLESWKQNVDKTLMFIENETPELFQ